MKIISKLTKIDKLKIFDNVFIAKYFVMLIKEEKMNQFLTQFVKFIEEEYLIKKLIIMIKENFVLICKQFLMHRLFKNLCDNVTCKRFLDEIINMFIDEIFVLAENKQGRLTLKTVMPYFTKNHWDRVIIKVGRNSNSNAFFYCKNSMIY